MSKYNSLNKVIKLSDKMKSLKDKSWVQLYDIVDFKSLRRHLLHLINISENDLFDDGFIEFYEVGSEKYNKMLNIIEQKQKGFKFQYYKNINLFKKTLSDLYTLRQNLYCMSGDLKPFTQYLTPQCGEVIQHQILLNKFATINKNKIKEYDN
jgi:hypothetical protein